MPDEVSFGRWLKQRRKALDLTQEALAERVGCAAETLRRYEADRLRPSREVAARLAEQLALAADERAAFVRAARGQPASNHVPGAVGDQTVERAQPPTAGRPRHNLPVLRQPLLGRERELAELATMVRRQDVGLVTLTGAGGSGKTRLALELATTLLDDFADGVWFVELASLSNAALVGWAIAHMLGVVEVPAQPIGEMLQAYLRERRLLLVLDNFEHVVAAASLIVDLLTAAPHLKVLVTSRILLHLSGEHEYPVPPLALPDPRHSLPPEDLAHYAAIKLFTARAQAVKPTFHVDAANGASVARICRRLDGLPLAIELAAPRIKVFTPQVLLTRLDQRLAILTGGARDLPPRQQTLRATLDWSYHLLNPDEQTLFARLGVFAGGCTYAAVEAVCRLTEDQALDVLNTLQSLLDKSLLQYHEAGGAERHFTMLETLREYAIEQLQMRGELEPLRRAHATYYLDVAEQGEVGLAGPDHIAWLDRLEGEHDNLRAALSWTTTAADGVETAPRLAGTLWPFWEARGYLNEGRMWLEIALAASKHRLNETNGACYAKALRGAGVLAGIQGEYQQATAWCEEGLSLYQALGDTSGMALAYKSLGALALYQGRYPQAQWWYEQSLALQREAGSRWHIAWALFELGHLARYQGDYARTETFCTEALALFHELGANSGAARALNTLGDAALDQGDLEQAQTCYGESMTLHRHLGSRWGIGVANFNQGRVAHLQGDYGRATTSYEASLALFRELGDRRHIGYALSGLGRLARLRADYGAAEALTRESLDLFQALGNKQLIARALIELGYLKLERADAAQAVALFRESLEIGYALGTAHLIAGGLAALASAAVAGGEAERAARLLGAMEGTRAVAGRQYTPVEQQEYDRVASTTRAQLDAPTFAAAFAVGQAMTVEQAIAYALDRIDEDDVINRQT